MTLRKPLTRTSDETRLPASIVDGTVPHHPTKSSSTHRTDAGQRPASRPSSVPRLLTSKRLLAPCLIRSSCDGEHVKRLNIGLTVRVTYPGAKTRKPKPALRRLGPGLVQPICHVDDLRRLRLGRVDFVGDVLGDESPDLAVDAGKDAQDLAAQRLGRHVDR